MKNGKTKDYITRDLTVIFIAILATWLGNLLPVIGGAVFGIIIGIIINNIIGKPKNTIEGVAFTSKKYYNGLL